MPLHLRYRLIDLARGTNSVQLLGQLRRWQFESPESLAQRGERDVLQYFEALQQSIALYRGVARFEDLPVLDKQAINANRGALMNPHYRGRVLRKKTGGSTGEPLVYFTSELSQSYLWAGIFLAWEAAGYKLGDKVAFLAGSSLFGTGYKQKLYYRLLNVRVLSAFDMSAERMDAYAAAIVDGGFRLLYGYASAIHQLALHLLTAGKRSGGALRGVVCTAEMLTPVMRRDIEAAFGVPCFSQYGCNDAGVSAFECSERNGFHLISTRSHVEVLPDGRLIATDMANTAMFMPRYDTGDLVRMSGRVCACGRGLPLIDEVTGRQNDLVTDQAGKTIHSEFFTHMFREDSRIRAFQVVYDARSLVVNVHGSWLSPVQQADLAAPYISRVRESLQFEDVRFEFDQPFVTLANAKHRFVMRRPST